MSAIVYSDHNLKLHLERITKDARYAIHENVHSGLSLIDDAAGQSMNTSANNSAVRRLEHLGLGIDSAYNSSKIATLARQGLFQKSSWLRVRTLNYWNNDQRKSWKNNFRDAKPGEITLVIPDRNLGLGDYYFTVAITGRLNRMYHLLASKKDLTLCAIIEQRPDHSVAIADSKDFNLHQHAYQRIIPISQLPSEAFARQATQMKKLPNINDLNKKVPRILCQSYSGNKNKSGNDCGYIWIKTLLEATSQHATIYLMQTTLSSHRIEELMTLKTCYGDKLRLIPPSAVFGEPNTVFHYINFCDIVIGISCTLTCMSASLGKSTILIYPIEGGNPKWLQDNPELQRDLFPNLEVINIDSDEWQRTLVSLISSKFDYQQT